MVSPADWAGDSPLGVCVGEARLQPDMTWTFRLSDAARLDPAILAWISTCRRQMAEQLESADTLGGLLPGYNERQSFFPRVMTSGLAFSLRASLGMSGLAQMSYQSAQAMIGASGRGKCELPVTPEALDGVG